ncbi:MAG: hypothetical protein M3Y81_29235 [Chloroflexota bacterium]|nr:hypothetical protein [Chloroflexota bacterium]
MHMTAPFHKTPIVYGQEDVRPPLHIPMVYEQVQMEPASWEYQVLTIDAREEALLDAERLNEMGGKGWFLVGMLDQGATGKSSLIHYYFVRSRTK